MAGPQDPRALLKEQDKRREDRLFELEAAFVVLYGVMHKIDGSVDPGEHQEHRWSSRKMSIAATHLETAKLFMEKHIGELE